MATKKIIRNRIFELKKLFDGLKEGKSSLLDMIDEAEIPENVFNSNAIENSTLTLKETEKILLEMEVSRDINVREVFEAKNLYRVIGYIKNKAKEEKISKELILLLHKMLITGINDEFSGRFRKTGEYVRVGTYIADAPEQIDQSISKIIDNYRENLNDFFIDKIAKFHLDFENVHPFCDGNGRIGRVLMCFQLLELGLPLIIIRDKQKDSYYEAFKLYREKRDTSSMEKIIALALLESLNKRLTYLKNEKIISLSWFVKLNKLSAPRVFNAAKRQSIPAFREKGVWKIGENFEID